MNSKINISDSLEELSQKFAQLLITGLNDFQNRFSLALSGGSTPKFIFKYLAKNFKDKINWEKINLFWGDERCVPPDHADSNYKMAFESLISEVGFPYENIFRIRGEIGPDVEAINYSNVISENVSFFNGLPRFDLIMLGLGEDGHTASIFPNKMELLDSGSICSAVEHPSSGQKRITLTGRVINNAKKVAFLVTGESKDRVVDMVLNKKQNYDRLPASFICPVDGELLWLLDKQAARLIYKA